MLIEIERVASLNTKKFAVHAGVIAVIRADNLAISHSNRCLTAFGTVRTDRAHMRHVPGACLVAIRAGCKRAYRAYVDAGAALIAFQVIALVGNDFRRGPAIADAERGHSDPFRADSHATITKNAARRVII